MSVTLEVAYGDLVLLPEGVYNTVTDEPKLKQDTAESLLNNRDSENPDWFNGSGLFEIEKNPLVTHELGVGAEVFIYSEVDESILRLMNLQDDDPAITSREKIQEIYSLNVHKLGNSSYLFVLILKNEAGEPVEDQFKIKLLSEIPPAISETLVGGLERKLDQGKTFL